MEQSIIQKGIKIDGKITSSSDLYIHGEVLGQIESSAKVIIAKEGIVRAEIKAAVVQIAGKLFGNIQATELIHAVAGAKIKGNLTTPEMVFEKGALLNGNIDMDNTSNGNSAFKSTVVDEDEIASDYSNEPAQVANEEISQFAQTATAEVEVPSQFAQTATVEVEEPSQFAQTATVEVEELKIKTSSGMTSLSNTESTELDRKKTLEKLSTLSDEEIEIY